MIDLRLAWARMMLRTLPPISESSRSQLVLRIDLERYIEARRKR